MYEGGRGRPASGADRGETSGRGRRGLRRARARRNLVRHGGVVMAIDRDLLEILVCPKCKGEVRLTDEGDGLTCSACKLLYPIRDDIPVMLVQAARSVD